MKISRDNPCYYLTSVAHKRLPVFQTDKIKQITANALDEARKSGDFLIFAYVIMPDHIHLITDGTKKSADVLRFTNGITARRVINFLKENNFENSLLKLRQTDKNRNHKYTLFEHHANVFLITNETTFMQKAHYIHQNPVRGGLVNKAENYIFSSARIWLRKGLDNEPLKVDFDKIDWRKS